MGYVYECLALTSRCCDAEHYERVLVSVVVVVHLIHQLAQLKREGGGAKIV